MMRIKAFLIEIKDEVLWGIDDGLDKILEFQRWLEDPEHEFREPIFTAIIASIASVIATILLLKR